jgi:hypothetical protein
VGTAGRRACPEPGGPDRRGPSRSRAQLGRTGTIPRRAWQSRQSGTRVGWTSRCSGATGAPAWRTDVGRSHTWADAAGSANMGRASSSATFDAGASASRAARDAVSSAASATGSAELGCDSRAARSGLGGATGRRAPRSGTAARPASATSATGRRAAATGADLGVPPRRGSARSSIAGFVGRRPAGGSSAQLGLDRLGIALGQRSAGSATRAFVE